MRVLFLHSYFTNPEGVVSSRSYDLCQGLIKRGHRVTIITQLTSFSENLFKGTKGLFRYLSIDGIELIGIGVTYANKMGILTRLCSFFVFMFFASFVALKVRNVDIVFATSTPPTIVVPAIIVKLFRRVPFVLELRDIWPDFVEQLNVIPWMPKTAFSVMDSLMKWVYRRADWVTTTTDGMKEIIAKKGINRGKLGTIRLGSKNEMFAEPCEPHPILQSPILKGKFVICYLGSISYGYKLDRLLDIAELIRDSDQNVAFLIMGRGGANPQLHERVERDKLTNVLIAPAVEYRRVPGILMHVQVGYESSYPSLASDTAFDNKFYDYMAAGLPILTNYDGDMANYLRTHECGNIAEKPEDAVRQIREWANNPSELARLSTNARTLAQGELSRELQVQKFVDLLERFVYKNGA